MIYNLIVDGRGLKLMFDQRIQMNYDKLSTNEKEMLTYIMGNRKDIIKMSLVELGENLLSSKSSVLRFTQKLGFRGYTDMKYSLEQSLTQVAIEPTDLTAILRSEISKTFNYAEQVNFHPLIDKMHNSENVYLYATGFSQNNMTKEFSNDIFLSGRLNFLISGETNFEMITHKLTPQDLVIITSMSGNTQSIQGTIKNLNMNKVPICSVTTFGKNFLSAHSNFQLYYETSLLPSHMSSDASSMIGLNIILTILARKYREFILFDE